MISVAIIGPDGAGKSTLTRRLEDEGLSAPVKRIYMGVNLEASGLMLPTTKLLLAVKSLRGRRSDMRAPTEDPSSAAAGPVRRTVKVGSRGVRMLMWLAEEWFRQLVAQYYIARGYIVVFDRHFYADYYHADVAAQNARSLASRLHGIVLRHAYPKPDLVICLDAPGRLLFERKGEASVDWLERRRGEYLQLAGVFPEFVVVDVDRPQDVVTSEVATVINEFIEKRRA